MSERKIESHSKKVEAALAELDAALLMRDPKLIQEKHLAMVETYDLYIREYIMQALNGVTDDKPAEGQGDLGSTSTAPRC